VTVDAALPMTEAELQQAVIECARTLGWLVAHFRPAKTEKGWRTAVEADGAGFPDLVLVRGDSLLFIELKNEKRPLTLEQETWIQALRKVAETNPGLHGFVWRPESWRSGRVEEVLR
jgi:hypothetical protein